MSGTPPKKSDKPASKNRWADEPPVKKKPAPPIKHPPAKHPPARPPAAKEEPAASPTAPRPAVQGMVHDPVRRWSAYHAAAALALLAVFGMGPAMLAVVEYFRAEEPVGLANWAKILLLVGLLQLFYVVYVAQLPDWSTVWVAAMLMLSFASVYALAVGVLAMSPAESPTISLFDLADHLRNGRAIQWCLIEVLLLSTGAYFCGRASVRWRKLAMK